MKLWAVLYLAGKIAAVSGPLPYDMTECLARTKIFMEGGNRTVTTPEGYTLSDIKMECLETDIRPKLED